MVGRSTDAELCARILAGDKKAFASVYDRYSDRLYDYAYSLLRDHHEAADAIQETFLVVANRLNQLNDPARLRPWLYAITRNCALHAIRARNREVPDEVEEFTSRQGHGFGDMPDIGIGPDREAEVNELRDLVWAAAAGLSEKEQSLLNLHLRHGLDGSELGAAMGMSANQANVAMSRLRDQIEKSIGALLVTRLGRNDCEGLREVLGDWDGKFSTVVRNRVVRHIETCTICSDRQQSVVSPWVLFGSMPLFVAPPALRDRVLGEVHLVALTSPTPVYRRPLVLATAALLIAAAIMAIFLFWPRAKPLHPGILADVTPPEIINQYASQGSIFEEGCAPQQATVKAEISDDESIALVEVRWDGPASAPMKNEDGVWAATLGPFQGAQLIHWRIVATDSSGNVTFGADQVLRVEACTESDAETGSPEPTTTTAARTTPARPPRPGAAAATDLPLAPAPGQSPVVG